VSGFEFLFSFYSLLLGLAVARVATGFADMWRGRGDTVVGISPCLLGLLVLFSAAQQWMSFWRGRDVLTMGPWQILVCIAVAVPYVFVSQAMLPREQDRWASLEEYYLTHRRVLLGVLLIPPIVSVFYNCALANYPDWSDGPFDLARICVPVLLMVWPKRWIHRLGLAALTVNMVVRLFA
jgi:hypothetical protein